MRVGVQLDLFARKRRPFDEVTLLARLREVEFPPMTEDERRRYLDGRRDWQESAWQDHCGRPGCEDCSGYIPFRNDRLAATRREVLS